MPADHVFAVQLGDLLVVALDELEEVVEVLGLDALLVLEERVALGGLEVVVEVLVLAAVELLGVVEVLVDEHEVVHVVLAVVGEAEDLDRAHHVDLLLDAVRP